jgi:HEPN domain-containing protein
VWAGQSLRTIALNLHSATLEGKPDQRMAETVLTHLGAAAEYICAGNPDRLSLAAWELHLALEKTMKLLLRQHQAKVSNTHDLGKLLRLLATNRLSTPLDGRVASLPTDKQAIKHRYSEIRPRSISAIMKEYRTVLSLALAYSTKMERRYTMNNAKILIRRGPWHRRPAHR